MKCLMVCDTRATCIRRDCFKCPVHFMVSQQLRAKFYYKRDYYPHPESGEIEADDPNGYDEGGFRLED